MKDIGSFVYSPSQNKIFSGSFKINREFFENSDSNALFKFKKIIYLLNALVISPTTSNSKENMFYIKTKEEKNFWIASSPQEKTEWTNAIEEQINQIQQKVQLRKDALKDIPISEPHLSEHEWDILFANGVEKSYQKGQVIIKQGEPSVHLYRIIKGTCSCQIEAKGHKLPLFSMKAGNAFGFSSFIGKYTATTSYIAQEEGTTVRCIESSFIIRLLRVEGEIGVKFYKYMAFNFATLLRNVESATLINPHQLTENHKTHLTSSITALDEEFRKRFPTLRDEVVVKEYNVSYRRNIAYYGTLYITQKSICFFAQVFGFNKKKELPLRDVVKLEKDKKRRIEITMKNYDDPIQETKVAIYTFENPSERDGAYNLINNIWKNYKESKYEISTFDKKPVQQVKEHKSEALEALGRSSFFSEKDLPTREDWTLILKGAKYVTFEKDQFIIREGEYFQRLSQVLMGKCRIEKTIRNQQKVLGHIDVGEIVGELSFLQGKPASASVIANEHVELFMIEGYSLNVLFDLKPGLAGRFYKYLSTIIEKRLNLREKQLCEEKLILKKKKKP